MLSNPAGVRKTTFRKRSQEGQDQEKEQKVKEGERGRGEEESNFFLLLQKDNNHKHSFIPSPDITERISAFRLSDFADCVDCPSPAMSKQEANESMIDKGTNLPCNGREESPMESVAGRREQKVGQRQEIVWRNVILMTLLHVGAVYSLCLIPKAHVLTLIWAYLCFVMCALGVTAGAHRLWSHRSYKAKLPLRIFLAIANSMAFQNDIFEWARDHRVHHKYSETDADPHNAQRGFFFSHIGWLFVRKHRDVIEKGSKLDFSDLLNDPVVIFQRKHYVASVILLCFVIPTIVPWYFWKESLWNSYFLASILRYTVSLNVAWLVNSAAHMYGNRPYDKSINPRENALVTIGAIGEGFHNYHHTFPFDYSASELGLKFNPTTWFIDFMFWLGLVTERKHAPKEMIQARKERTGDGSS